MRHNDDFKTALYAVGIMAILIIWLTLNSLLTY